MYSGHVQVSRASNPVTWLAIIIAFAIAGALVAPWTTVSAQTPVASEDSGVTDIVPDTAYLFAKADLDTQSDQMALAMDLINRAGLGDMLGEDALSEEEIPANAQVGIAVTSIPEPSEFEVDAVAVDPMAASETLDEGGYAIILRAEGMEAFYQQEIANLQANGGDVSESEYGGVTITSSTPAADDEFSDPSAVAMVGDYAVMAARAEDIHPLIDTFNGDLSPLAENENYQAIMDLLPAESLASGFVNGPALRDYVETASAEAFPGTMDSALNLVDSWTGFTFSAEEQGFRFESRSIANAEPFDEITTLDGSFLDTVPSEALFVANGTDIDSTGIVTLLSFLFASELVGGDEMATPAADFDLEADQDQVFAEAESILGFNLKTDFVDQLVGEFGMFVTVGELTDPSGIPAIDALIVSDVEDPLVVQDVISTISFIAGAALGDQGAIETREVNGSSVNVIDLTGQDVGTERIEFGVVNNEFVISAGEGLDAYILGTDTPLSSDPSFTAVMESLPSEYGSITYVNTQVVLELVMGFSDSLDVTGGMDADPSCGDYASQEEAQAAYDEDQFENFQLDQDFDGEACEDYFDPQAATPAGTTAVPYSNVLGLASVTTQEDGVRGTSTFLLIGDE